MLKNKDIKKLKYIAHSTEINKYNIGKEVLKDTVYDLLDKALEANELIKVNILNNSDIEVKELSIKLKDQLNCEIVQIIGHTLVIYRESFSNKKVTKQLYD